MLSKFTISNFKSFNSEFTLDLNENREYQFNSESIKTGVVNHSIVYGYNGTGKSNLGLAIFDIIDHLTDFEHNNSHYTNYLNAFNESEYADFEYEFKFNENIVKYWYKKKSDLTLVFELLSINGKEVAMLDRNSDSYATILLSGTDTLNKDFSNSSLSLLKYIRSNSILEKNEENDIFNQFFKFIDGMLFFRSLDENMYIGLEAGNKPIMLDIIERGNVKNLEKFLNDANIEAKLEVVESNFGKQIIAFDFKGVAVPLDEAASTGTRALVVFYYWLQRVTDDDKVTFIYLDEFDAFYHHSLAKSIVNELKKTRVQFVLTTHNTSIMSNDLLRPDCYFQMSKNSILSLADKTKKELREAHNIEKMYKAGSFNG